MTPSDLRKLAARFPISKSTLEANQAPPISSGTAPGSDSDARMGSTPQNTALAASSQPLKLNKTEAAYLAHLRSLGFDWIDTQNITLRLAHDCRFTPDFSFIDEHGRLVMVDVKGFQREDALIKIKVAARLFPWITFRIVKRGPNPLTPWLTQTIKP